MTKKVFNMTVIKHKQGQRISKKIDIPVASIPIFSKNDFVIIFEAQK